MSMPITEAVTLPRASKNMNNIHVFNNGILENNKKNGRRRMRYYFMPN